MATPIPSNVAQFSLEQVAQATQGELRADAHQIVVGVSSDTRADLRGRLFVALRGERFDGHAFSAQAVQQGACAVLCEGTPDPTLPCIVVPDTLKALGDLALYHRRRWGKRVVAVAGSAGKTTTRSVSSALLQHLYGSQVHVAAGNLNNRIGVPMVLFGLQEHHDLAVIELGTNTTGELAELVRISEPDVGVLTLIDREHSEGLGDLDAIEHEEAALLRVPLELALGNGDDERVLRQLRASPAKRRLAYGFGQHCEYRVTELQLLQEAQQWLSQFTLLRPDAPALQLQTPFLGVPGALATAVGCAVTEQLATQSLTAAQVQAALQMPSAREPGRLQPVSLADGSLVIDDSYNANPASVRAALEFARQVADARSAQLHVVLGEMRELGPWATLEHHELIADIRRAQPTTLLALCGEAKIWLQSMQHAPDSAHFFESSSLGAAWLLPRVQAGDVVLVKASRGVRAELLVHALVDDRGPAR